MSFFQRAATLAALALSVGGLISNSAPAKATQADPAVIFITPTLNAPAPTPVPEISSTVAPPTAEPTPASFSTLDEAIAASRDAKVEDEAALRCLATTIFYESKGEPLAGQLAVAHVVLNRAKSGRFAADVCGVVKQRGQFSFVRGGVLPTVDAGHRLYRTALAVAKVALADAWKSPAPRALFFNGRRVGLPGRLTKVALIGNHVFYR